MGGVDVDVTSIQEHHTLAPVLGWNSLFLPLVLSRGVDTQDSSHIIGYAYSASYDPSKGIKHSPILNSSAPYYCSAPTSVGAKPSDTWLLEAETRMTHDSRR